LDGKTVDAPEWLKQRKVKELLYFILANRNGLTKDEIGGELWKDSSPAELKLAFKNTIYRLRHALGQDVISFDEDRYWFNSNLDYEYDVESFLKLIREAKEAVTKKEKVDYYLRAIEYCQGTYLPDVDGAWVLVEREKLWRLFVEANLKLANIYLEDGDYSATIEHCQQVLNADPCLEEAHRMMMLAYAGKGNRAAVTRQYEQCRQALLEEVNAQPSPQTAELYEALKS
jgi:DNA-binding SARP family transcriptional activator